MSKAGSGETPSMEYKKHAKPEFTVSSLDSDVIIISQINHCLWYHYLY